MEAAIISQPTIRMKIEEVRGWRCENYSHQQVTKTRYSGRLIRAQ
jgi:hypothetical protein